MKKTALVTGACINTGVAIVEMFASKGWDVVFTGRNIDAVMAKEKEYNEKYPDVYKFLSDMYNVIINPNTDAEKKVADKDGYVEMSLDHTLRALESLK